jgi:hypothetical protein
MKDLVICYDNENGETKGKSYDTIMDFIDEMESDEMDIPMLDYTNVYAEFFERIHHGENFQSIEQLLERCKRMLK